VPGLLAPGRILEPAFENPGGVVMPVPDHDKRLHNLEIIVVFMFSWLCVITVALSIGFAVWVVL
jgi:hypothetical protein